MNLLCIFTEIRRPLGTTSTVLILRQSNHTSVRQRNYLRKLYAARENEEDEHGEGARRGENENTINR